MILNSDRQNIAVTQESHKVILDIQQTGKVLDMLMYHDLCSTFIYMNMKTQHSLLVYHNKKL